MPDITIQELLFRGAAMVIVASLHGFVLAALAALMGDRRPRLDGRLTPNPAAHLDLIGLVAAALFGLGWGRPLPLDPAEMRLGRFSVVLCVLASLAAMLALAWLVQLLRLPAVSLLPDGAGLSWVLLLIDTTARLAIWFAVFNLVPIPPLAGAQVWTAVAPGLRPMLTRLYFYGAIVLVILLVTNLAEDALKPALTWLTRLLVS